MLQGDFSITEKKKNRERWRKGMLESVIKEKIAVEYRRDFNSENFLDMFAKWAPHEDRVAVINELGFQGACEYLYKELMKFYDKG